MASIVLHCLSKYLNKSNNSMSTIIGQDGQFSFTWRPHFSTTRNFCNSDEECFIAFCNIVIFDPKRAGLQSIPISKLDRFTDTIDVISCSWVDDLHGETKHTKKSRIIHNDSNAWGEGGGGEGDCSEKLWGVLHLESSEISSIIIFRLSELIIKATFFILYNVIFLVRLQGKFDVHSWEWQGENNNLFCNKIDKFVMKIRVIDQPRTSPTPLLLFPQFFES